ncbi:Os08g0232201 [Oryza sativa Japonica Group]|uniref:Os08g0232201 protein n=1 Tax=Oryza sativa subsp. japonica TaxID=39947 RepID=A0A0P0XDA6_ORYSJ|nr:Os08g0232201 [Oryza sativa Japonica Group]
MPRQLASAVLASSASTCAPLPPRPHPMTPWLRSTPSAPPTPTLAVSIFRANLSSQPLPFFQAVEARPHGGVVGAHGHGEGAAALEQLLHSALVALPLGAVVIGNLVVSLTAAPTSCRRGGGGDGSNGRGGGTGRGAMGGVPAGACGLGFSMEESSREGNKLGLAF